MIPKYKATKITAIFQREYYNRVWNRLKKAGVYNVHQENARYPVLGIRRGFNTIFNNDPIVDVPMVLLNIITFPDIEKKIMEIIRDAADLEHPGHGSVFSEDISLYHENSLFFVTDSCEVKTKGEKFFSSFTGIYCILQRGLGDSISKLILENGIGVPTISFGTGTGLRDKLGLLKVTIPREKEILKLIVNSMDVHHVMDFIIDMGKLDYPGRGFIYEFPVKQGLINTRVSLDSNKQAANIEQIIAELDKLSGGIEWRKRGAQLKSQASDRKYFHGVDIHFFCNEGYGLEIIRELRKVGVTGSTMRNPKLVCKSMPNMENTGYKISPAREACNMIVPQESLEEIIEFLEEMGAFGEKIQGMLYTTKIPKAFTYQSKTQPQKLANSNVLE